MADDLDEAWTKITPRPAPAATGALNFGASDDLDSAWDKITPHPLETPDQSSATGAFARRAGAGVLPTLAGFPAAGAGAELGGAGGAALGTFFPPAAPFLAAGGALAGGVGGFLGGSAAVDAAQEAVLKRFPALANLFGQSPEQIQADEEQHPYASMAGSVSPLLLGMRPGAIPKVAEDASAIEKLLGHPILSRGLGAGVGAAQAIAQQSVSGEPYDPTQIGLNALIGAILNRETKLGSALSRGGAKAVPKFGRNGTGNTVPPNAPVVARGVEPEGEAASPVPPTEPATQPAVAPPENNPQVPPQEAWVHLPDSETGEPAAWFNPATGETRALENPPQSVNVSRGPTPENPAIVPEMPAPAPGGQGPVLQAVPGSVPEAMAQGRGQTGQEAPPAVPAPGEVGSPPGAAAAAIEPQEPVAPPAPAQALEPAQGVTPRAAADLAAQHQLDVATAARLAAEKVQAEIPVRQKALGERPPTALAKKGKPEPLAQVPAVSDEAHGATTPESTTETPKLGNGSITPDQARQALKTGIDPTTGKRPVGNKALRDMRGLMAMIVKNEKGPLAAKPQVSRENVGIDKSLLMTIHAMGGIKTKDAAGNLTKEGQDVMALVKDHKMPGLINNKDGTRPDQLRSTLQQQGWFRGEADQGDSLQTLYDHLDRAVRGEKIYHPESEIFRQTAVAKAQEGETQARDDIRRHAEEAAQTPLTDAQVESIREDMTANGKNAYDALHDHIEREAVRDENNREPEGETHANDTGRKSETDLPFGEPAQVESAGAGGARENQPAAQEPSGHPGTPVAEKPAVKYPIAPKSEWYGNANYEQTGGKLIEMSPDDYLAKVRPLKIDETSRDNIDDLKRHIESGKTLDPLSIRADGKEDGRHRAVAAKELGIKKVPVLTWEPKAEAKAPSKDLLGEPAKKPTSEMIQDAGEKIGGARKDKWAERGLNLSDLENMSEGEAFQHTTKDQVWPKSDYAKMVEDGADPLAVAHAKLIRDRLASRPDRDSASDRRDYVEMMGHARDVLSNVKTMEDVKKAAEAIRKRAGWPEEGIASDAVRKKLFSIYKTRSDPLRIGYDDMRKAQELIRNGFPAKVEPWTRRFEVRKKYEGEGFVVTAKGKYKGLDEAPTKAEAEAKAKALYESSLKGGENAEKLPERPHLDKIKRTGADVRGGRDIDSEDFVKDFGFRGIEFGNWVASDERQKSTNLAYEALHDLANTLGVPPKAISLDGHLGLAFGARGSGKFAAHYEPGKLVINLTKLSGAGSLAHEWGHALDHYFGTLDTEKGTKGEPKGASGWYTRTRERASQLKNLRPEMAEAFDKLMGAIFTVDKERAEAVRDAELRVEDYQAAIAKQQKRIDDIKDKAAQKSFIKDSQTWIEQRKAMLEAAGRRLAELRDEKAPYTPAKVASSYYREAIALSGKSGESGYWTRPTELFARSFESYVFDKIKEGGNASDYLVQGVEPDRYSKAKGYKGNPYPAGLDRTRIDAAFDHIFKTIKTREGDDGRVAMFARRDNEDMLDMGPDGLLPQKVIPGAERLTAEELQKREIAKRMEGKKQGKPGQKSEHGLGLFGGEAEATKEVKKKDQGSLFARRDEKTFYSALGRTVDDVKQAKAPAGQWKAIIKNAQGVKREEVEWSGIEQWLDDQKDPVTKEAVQEFLRENNVDVREVEKGQGPSRAKDDLDGMIVSMLGTADVHPERIDAMSDEILNDVLHGDRQHGLRRLADLGVPHKDINELELSLMSNTKHHQYQLPGGENYRELLLTLPANQERLKAEYEAAKKRMAETRTDHPSYEQRMRETTAAQVAHLKGGEKFRSSHFDEPNVLAHVRFNDRTDADGKKVLFLEEVQSDWHQKGRRTGYADPKAVEETSKRLDDLRPSVNEMLHRNDQLGFDSLQEARAGLAENPRGWDLESEDDYKLGEEWQRAFVARADAKRAVEHGIPDAPFKQSWHELAMKRMLRYAAEKGYDRVAWTTGEQQAERYDLSKQVKRIDYLNDEHLLATGLDGRLVIDQKVPPEKLTDYIGKEAAERLMKQPQTKERMVASKREIVGHARTLEGVDLKVGGEGMKGFYDKILPSFLNKYAKKWGARVGETQLGDNVAIINKDGKEVWSGERRNMPRLQPFDRVVGQTAHSIDVTPAMRESVMQGQPMFARGEAAKAPRQFEDIGHGVYGALSEEMRPQREAMAKALRERLDALGLHDAAAKVYDALYHVADDGKIHTLDGYQLKKVISTALDAKGAEFVLDHEAIHAMRALDLFTDKEWKILSDEATKTWHAHYKIGERYADFDPDIQTEEAIAHAFQDWRKKAASAPVLPASKRIFNAVRDALRAIAHAFGAHGFDTTDSIFEKAASGKVGSRPRTVGEGTPNFARRAPGIVGTDLGKPDPSSVDYLTNKNLDLMERLKGAVSGKALGESMDRWRVGFQDRFLPVLRTQQRVEQALGRPLTEQENAYLKQEGMAGRIGSKFQDLGDTVSDLIHGMAGAKISREELEAYLYARHAPERNAQIDKINPKFRADMLGPGEPGSGMSDDDAKAIMDAVGASGKKADFEALAKQVDDILAGSVKERVAAGLMSQAEADAWKGTYKNYVPLRGKAELDPEFDTTRPRTAGGLSVSGKESQRAFGRTTPARDILAHTLMQAEEAIARGETNRVTQAFHDLAKAAPDGKFWKVDKIETRPVWNKAKQQVEYQSVSHLLAKDKDYTVSTKINGVEHRITMNRDNPVARRLAEAMKGLPDHQVGKIIQIFGGVNRMLSHVNTTLSPEFVITNAIRDAVEAFANLRQYDTGDLIKNTMKHYPGALKAAMKSAFGNESGDWGKWAHEFRANGGRVYFNRLEDISAMRKKLAAQLHNASSGPSVLKALHAVGRTIENVNSGVENGIRLAAYRSARESGMSEAHAASLAKNLTVNFNRRGSYGPLLNSFYLFYNASVQGSATLLTAAAKSARVRQALGAAIALGAAMEITNSMTSGKDKDGESFYDKATAYEKSRNLIIMDPGGSAERIKIPLPYGYSAFFGIGRAMAELYRGKPAGEVSGNLATTIVNAFNPIGGAGGILRTISPTILSPVIDLSTNTDYAGRNIAPSQPEHGAAIPNTQRYWGSVSPVSKAITDFLGSETGGDQVKPGLIDVSPEVLDYVFGQVAGSAGAFYNRNLNTGFKLLDPNSEISWNDIPFARRVVGGEEPWLNKGLFYQRVDQIDQALSYVKNYAKQGEAPEARGELAQNKAMLELAPLANTTREALSQIRAARGMLQLAKEKGAIQTDGYNAKMKQLKATEDRLITQFNTQFVKRGLVPGVSGNAPNPANNGNQEEPDDANRNPGTGAAPEIPEDDQPQNNQGRQADRGADIERDNSHSGLPQKGSRSNTALADAVKSRDADALQRLADSGVSWTKAQAVNAVRASGFPATAQLLASMQA